VVRTPRALTRKLLRDLWHLRGQMGSIALVVATGVMTVLTMRGGYESLRDAQDAYYRQTRFPEVWSTLKRAPRAVEEELEAVEGVAAVETRVTFLARLRLPGLDVPGTGRFVSLPEHGRAALGDLLEHYQHRLYNTVLRMVGSRDDAEELTQDVMVKVITHIQTYDGRAALSTWMTSIAMNLSISHLRKRRLRRMPSIDAPSTGSNHDDGLGTLRDRLPDSAELSPDQCVEQGAMTQHLHHAIARLDADFRAVLVLRDINEMDYAQIADALDVPVGTVKSRLFRARVALRQVMSESYPSLAVDRAGARQGVSDA